MQNISTLLSHTPGPLHDMLQRSKQLQKLSQAIKSLLPEYLAAYCFVAAWEEDKVTVHVNNGAAGTVLRYQIPRLLPLLQSQIQYRSITQIICHIRPPATTEQIAEKKRSTQHCGYAAQVLQDAAANVTTSEVQAALQRLAKTMRTLKNG